jgi:hypothetical protein
VLFLAASVLLNTAKSLKDLPATAAQIDTISAYVFGIVPTLFASVLGVMQGFIDRLPFVQSKSATDTLPMLVYATATKWLTLVNARLSAETATDAPSDAKRCGRCGQMVQDGKKPGVMGAHAKHNCPKRKQVQP